MAFFILISEGKTMNIGTIARFNATQKAINELIESIKSSLDVLKTFDNKIINVKLINEIKSIGLKSYVSLQSNSGNNKILLFSANNRNESYKDERNHSNWAYAEIDKASVIIHFRECGKRLDFESTKQQVEHIINYLETSLRNYTMNPTEFEAIEKKFDSLHKELETLLSNIPWPHKIALLDTHKYRLFKF